MARNSTTDRDKSCPAEEPKRTGPDQTDELQAVDEALRQSEERLRQRVEEVETLMKVAPVAIWVAQDPHCDGIVGNRMADRFYEACEQENVSANVSPARRFFRAGRELTAEELPMQEAAAKNIDISNSELDVLLPSGKWLNMLGSASPLRDAEGQVRGCIGTFVDITERKRAEEALRESEERFRVLTANLRSGVALIDEDRKFALYNPAFLAMFGLAENSSVKNVNDQDWAQWQVFTPEGTLLDVDEHPVRKAALTGQAVQNQLVGVKCPAGGDLCWMLVSAEPIPRPNGRRAIICTYHDVTEQRRAEEALRQWNATLESKVAQRTAELQHRARQLQKLTLQLSEAEERERRRIAVLLHEDLQQQIAGARFHLGLVRNRAGDKRLRTEVERVEAMLTEAIEKSRRLSHDLSPAVLHLNDLTEVLRWLARRVQEQHDLTVHLQATAEMTLHSEALTMFLFRAAQEMLSNVVRHARIREATIRVRRCGRHVVLTLADRGRGFDPRQLHETAGFGLLSIRERVELLGGRMGIRSVPGRGSAFRIVVPDGPAGQSRQTAGDAAQVPAPSTAASSVPLDGTLRVLLVDDHDIVRQGLAALLQDACNIEVVGEAADGGAAIDLTYRLHPDVVIMDVSMPLMSGAEATRQIKTHLPQTRVIALSMYDEVDKKERMYEAGAEGYILKTVTAEELLAAIRGRKPDA